MQIKKWMACLLICLLLVQGAMAEIFVGTDVPEDWAQRDLLRLIVVDTDRSDAMILQCGGETMMVDGSTRYYHPWVFEQLDRWMEEPRVIKCLFSTHSDNDHIQGFEYVMDSEKYEVEMFASANDINYVDGPGYHQACMKVLKKQNIPYHVLEDGEDMTLGSAQLKVMRCLEAWGRNARSAVLMVTFGESRLLLTGDIDNATMSHFVQKYGAEALKADVIKAPHHGLATFPEKFTEAVSPELIFVPNLYKNVKNFDGYMRKILPETDILYSGDGTLILETDGKDWYVWQEENDNYGS